MKAQLFEIELLESTTPEPDPVARQAAVEAAMGEFARAQRLRPVAGTRDAEHLYTLRELARQLPHPERDRTEFRRSRLVNFLAGAVSACIVASATALMGSQRLHRDTHVAQMDAALRTDSPFALNVMPMDVPPPMLATPAMTPQSSTFSIDVDTASYTFVRRNLVAGVLPHRDAVRAEEMINYFDYSWRPPVSPDQPFRATIAVSDSPWNAGRKLVHIGIKGYELPQHEEPDVNLVLLLDVSGSMDEPDRLPLVKQSVELLLRRLKLSDTVAIVAYAGEASVVLRPTEVRQWQKIVGALQALRADGSTAGAAGINLAYELARSSFRPDGVNRILLATDGDFNVGMTSPEELRRYVARARESGIFLSVLGFGVGNYDDETAQALAQNGNGVAAYIDTLDEAQKVLAQEATASLFTIAKDVKLQVEFNPDTVSQYRLVGYETRGLRQQDFDDDAVDAGDIGSGHSVTAIYEITPAPGGDVVPTGNANGDGAAAGRVRNEPGLYGWLKIRYKRPESRASELLVQSIPVETPALSASLRRDTEFATAVAGFAQLLRQSADTGALSYDDVIRQAQAASGDDPYGYRAEFVELVRKARNAGGGD